METRVNSNRKNLETFWFGVEISFILSNHTRKLFLFSVGRSEASFSLRSNCPLPHDNFTFMLGKLLMGMYFMVLAVPLQKRHERESIEKIFRQWEATV